MGQAIKLLVHHQYVPAQEVHHVKGMHVTTVKQNLEEIRNVKQELKVVVRDFCGKMNRLREDLQKIGEGVINGK